MGCICLLMGLGTGCFFSGGNSGALSDAMNSSASGGGEIIFPFQPLTTA